MAYQVPPMNNRAMNIVSDLLDYLDKNASKYKSTANFSSTVNIPPSATSITESAVLNNSIDDVWNAIKSLTFDFSSAVKSTDDSSNTVGNCKTINYNDGTVQTIQITEISALSKCVSYRIISSTPSVSYSSANNTIKLIKVTTNNRTFIEWSTVFSNDAQLSVVRDSQFKKKEAFKDLRDYLSIQVIDDETENKESNALLSVSLEQSTEVNIDKLWGIVSDFGNVSYSAMVEKCTVTDGGSVRNMTIKGGGGQLSERITRIKPDQYTLGFSIIKNTALPVENYNSVITLSKVDNKGCKCNWTSTFNAKDVSDSLAKQTIKEVLQSGWDQMIAFAKK